MALYLLFLLFFYLPHPVESSSGEKETFTLCNRQIKQVIHIDLSPSKMTLYGGLDHPYIDHAAITFWVATQSFRA